MPEISVIIPCYNHGQYLSHALNSVLAQTYPDWEAIVVDDGSTDDTPQVAATFTDPRIRYIHQENRGLSAARNTGIRAAVGEFLAFLDADDEWEPRFLEVCHSALAADPSTAAVVTQAKFIDETGAVLPRTGGAVFSPEGFRQRLLEGGFFPVHAVLIRAEAVRQAGLFDEALTSVEDWDLWLRITAEGGVMQSIPEPLARYRVYPGSMATNAARMHANRMAVLTKQFGPPEGAPASWSADKRRAYAHAYRAAALGYLAQMETDMGWRYLRQAIETDPGLLQRLDTFYELALGDQPRGYRGQTQGLDLAANGAAMLRGMDALLADASPEVQALRGTAYGHAYLVLAMLADQAGDWVAARRSLWQAVRSHPRLLRDPRVVRRGLKLLLGRRVIGGLRCLRPRMEAAKR